SMGILGMHSKPSCWKWCSASQSVSYPSASAAWARAAAVSNVSTRRSLGYRRSSAGGPASPHRPSSMCPTYNVEKRVIIAARSRLRHVVPSEAGDALVLIGEALQLGARDVAVEVVERRVTHQLLHAADEIVGRLLAMGAPHPGGGSRPRRLVGGERGRWVAAGGEAVGERSRVEDGLGRAVG